MNNMLKSEVQHQFWLTKKTVERKLGTKEDEFIVLSDAELDAKLELFKYLSDSCQKLQRIINHYQERVCILAQEENILGKFLKETGKNSNSSSKAMICTGKAISYCGQQRLCLRPSLLRFLQEVETFQNIAVSDTYATISNMEKERTQYRAALSWMKSVSSQLDPDSGRNIEKFRKAQARVRLSKAKFDKLSLDCLEKIDLLSAARCNIFSHSLAPYMAALLQFATKSLETFKATAQALSTDTQYNFTVLKDVTENIKSDTEGNTNSELKPIDSDQRLFFLDEYTDEKQDSKNQDETVKNYDADYEKFINISSIKNQDSCQQKDLFNILELPEKETSKNSTNEFDDFVLHESNSTPGFMPSQFLLNDISINNDLSTFDINIDNSINNVKANAVTKSDFIESENLMLNISNNSDKYTKPMEDMSKLKSTTSVAKTKSKQDVPSWFNLFSELDPLASLDAIEKKIQGDESTNHHQAA